MALSFSLVKEGVSLGLEAVQPRVRDIFEVSANTEVVFDCPNRFITVRAVLSGSLNLTANSQWKGYFNVMPQLLNILDGGDQALFGRSIQQPWMGRQYWGGTEPMSFRLPLQFVSDTNAEEDVYKPAIALLSLLFPRQAKAVGTRETSFFGEYIVPGPSVFYTSNSDEPSTLGDFVSIRLGNMLDFNACYITSVSLDVENSYDPRGYPHCIKAGVSFKAMDSMFVGRGGCFTKLESSDVIAPEVLENLLKSAKTLATKSKSYVSNYFDRLGKAFDGLVDTLAGGSKEKPPDTKK